MPAESVLWGKLMSAIGRGDEQGVAELLKVGPCGLSRATRMLGNTALHRAAAAGNANVVQLLLAKGNHPTKLSRVTATNHDGWTPMHEAAYAGHDKVVELLVASGGSSAARNTDGLAPIALAKHRGHEWKVRAAICKGQEIFSTRLIS
eukprot:m.153174 g.153174  ORF g.153174 m.153174 type:complete len:148 (-) comp23433_c0_seq1:250-693(-)